MPASHSDRLPASYRRGCRIPPRPEASRQELRALHHDDLHRRHASANPRVHVVGATPHAPPPSKAAMATLRRAASRKGIAHQRGAPIIGTLAGLQDDIARQDDRLTYSEAVDAADGSAISRQGGKRYRRRIIECLASHGSHNRYCAGRGGQGAAGASASPRVGPMP